MTQNKDDYALAPMLGRSLQEGTAMSQHTPNELTAIFRRDHDLLTRLKREDAHYTRLADEYHEVNREVHRIEAETEAASDERTEALKRQRLALLDEITAILTAARASA
ncbi:YdcH family protein [Aurantiacibacter poecillastricola]|uniref:YdcH family protein n=1 Tax=Aurantiacibacter poecillastricola TaxID=3064385 RepID=UPI00273D9A73|nr:DUF465 domain-containing protein [Aurantiacibacter sp. 219JJ12-13]MDP5260828.1 DUF465 domain-containing protein [Aurantiacibacter sp. 219JJ12-13]